MHIYPVSTVKYVQALKQKFPTLCLLKYGKWQNIEAKPLLLQQYRGMSMRSRQKPHVDTELELLRRERWDQSYYAIVTDTWRMAYAVANVTELVCASL